MARRILVTSALPYANGPTHLGHMTETIQCDIWVRAMRLAGHEVIYVCADDTHGTPIMLKAEAEGITPEALIGRVGAERRADFAAFGIGFDNYYTTHSEENRRLTVRMYEALVKAGHITRRSVRQAFDEKAGMFLPDRYVKGTCPRCATPDQYGDSCENCGATYSPSDLIDPLSVVTGTRPVERESEHIFFRLGNFEAMLRQVDPLGRAAGRRRQQAGRMVRGGAARLGRLARRALFRHRDPGCAGQVLLRMAGCAGRLHGELRELLQPRRASTSRPGGSRDSDAELHHFIGKDILYFHSLFWPATLEGAGFRKPTAVHAHGFLTVNGEKMSKSRGTFVTARRYLDHLPPDYFRYFLAAKLGPGLEDIDMNLEEFATRINSDLVGKLVNIASRCASFIHRGYGGLLAAELPEPGLYREFVDAGAGIVEAWEIARVRRRRARDHGARRPRQPLHRPPEALARGQGPGARRRGAGRLHPGHQPVPRPDGVPQARAAGDGGTRRGLPRLAASRTGATSRRRCSARRSTNTSRSRHGSTPRTCRSSWRCPCPRPKRPPRPEPAQITPEDFARIDLRVARVETAEFVEGADRLLKLGVDLGGERRTVFAGIRGAYEPAQLVGRHVVIVANLKPKKMRFGTSEGMALAASGDEGLFLLSPDAGAKAGMKVS